ncbi:hypothetical protein Bca4012_081359 [Brassica carinata]
MSTTKFDVSPFMLLEASADSDGGGTGQIDGALDGSESIVNYYADGGDDKSCSASLYETSSCVTATSQRQIDPEEDAVNKEIIFTAVEEDDEDGEGVVNSYRKCGFVNVSVDSIEVVSEMDKSRMFWEACLASS